MGRVIWRIERKNVLRGKSKRRGAVGGVNFLERLGKIHGGQEGSRKESRGGVGVSKQKGINAVGTHGNLILRGGGKRGNVDSEGAAPTRKKISRRERVRKRKRDAPQAENK